MAGNAQGRGEASRQDGLEKAIDKAWDDYTNKNGKPSQPLTLPVQIQVVGSNPITAYIVLVGSA